MGSPNLWTPELAAEWFDEKLEQSRKQFARTNQSQLVSFREWCKKWDWAHRSDVYTHLLHSYPAKLLAYVPIAFLTSSLASPDPVMDCFAGTGTVLLECLAHKFSPRNCYGVEINPLARLIAKVKITPLQPNRLRSLAQELYRFIATTLTAPIPKFVNRDFWFRKVAQRDLARIRYCIEQMDATTDEKDFFRVCFSAIIRDMSRADPDVAPPVLLKPEKFPPKRQDEIRALLRKKQRADALVLFRAKVSDNLKRMESFVEQVGATPNTTGWIIWDDAREIKIGRYVEAGRIDKTDAPTLDSSIGMVITSPPYIAAQKYVRTTRLELLWLDLVSEEELRQLDQSTIGTERVTVDEQREFISVGNPTADPFLRRIHRSNPERAAIASRYYRDMRQSLNAIHRALKPGGVCVLVMGNNSIGGHIIPNHKILSEIASENGLFTTDVILRDSIRSRGLITKRHETAGVIDDEYVVVLRKRTAPSMTSA